jgi:hypothetical protein
VNVSGGITTYYGDLSKNNSLFDKFMNESRVAFSGKLTKHIRHTFGISGQLLYGGFKNSYDPTTSFSTSLFEYNIQGHVELINLFRKSNSSRLGLLVYGGIGQFFFSVNQNQIINDTEVENVYNSGVPEVVFIGGGELHYHISDKMSVTSNISIRRANNDKLDNHVKGNSNDYYSYLSVGISYHINHLTEKEGKRNLVRNQQNPRFR